MDRRKFLKGVAAGVTAAVAPAVSDPLAERSSVEWGEIKPITASEIIARRAAYLKELEEKIHKAIALPPEFLRAVVNSQARLLDAPDRKWFTLEVDDT